jgi:hypothetical protein
MKSQEYPASIVSNTRFTETPFNTKTNLEQQNQSESVTQVQKENATTSQNALDPLLRNGLIVSILALLFVASIYYGLIDP